MGGIHSCYNCTDRYVGCHSTCEKYLEEKEKNEERKHEERKQKELDMIVKGLQVNRVADIGRHGRSPKKN